MSNSIMQHIPEGRDNAIPRLELVQKNGTSDRLMRKQVEFEKEENGNIICNLQDGKGYYTPSDDDTESVLRQARITKAKAMKLLKQLKPMVKFLKERGAIKKWNEV